MKAPPLQRAEVVWITDLQPGTEVRGRQRSTSCLRRIGVAIALVLCAHWHFALVHTRRHDARPRDLFLSSFSSSSSRGTGRGRRRERRAPPPSPQVDDAAPYLVSPICGACSRALFDSRPCWTILERDAKKSHDGLTLRDAAAHLGRESENCALCDPERCWRHYHHNSTEGYVGADQRAKYWRFDRSGPRFSQPTTLTLATIPAELRIPPSRFDNIGTYFEEKYRLARANNASMDYLVEYNPGLAVLSAKMKEHLPKEATYLMSLRVTPANNCFSTQAYASLPQNVWNAVYHTSTNHLGLALLDEDYRTIPGYEAVVEIDAQLDLKRDLTTKKDRGGRKAGDYVETVSPTFMDYRLFVLNDEIYLHINADTVILSRLSLRAQGFGDDRAYAREVGACAAVVAAAGERGSWEKPCRLENLYGGDRLQVTLMRQFNTIWSGGANGKNYALFGVPDTKSPGAPDSVYAEIDIFPHHVQQILPEEHDRIEKQKIFDYLWKPGSRKSRDFKIDRVNMRKVREAGDIVESDRVPLPSYFTVDAHPDWFPGAEAPFKEGAHGGACCVLFSAEDMSSGGTQDDPPRESLLVGIGHTKVTWKPWYNKPRVTEEMKARRPHTHYVTLFYAFEPRPPFRVRARSGYFCLGHAPPTAEGGGDDLPTTTEGGAWNPRSVLTRNRGLQQNNVTFDCPQMSFVSSFIEKSGDPSRTVVGYGLNDCTGRLVEVEKREIVRLLFPDTDMIFETT